MFTFLAAFFSRAKNLSSILLTSTPASGTLVDVAMTYRWFTRRRGTPLTTYGPGNEPHEMGEW